MILTNRLFERQEPHKEAKSLYIFCEGRKREYKYFEFFKEKDSRVNVEIYKLQSDEDNSPKGLLNIVENFFSLDMYNSNPQFQLQPNDEVWIVLDTDPDKMNSRKEQIELLRNKCETNTQWFCAESNPCFEVWLLYHKMKIYISFKDDHICTSWKAKVNQSFSGGFDSRRHPIFIEDAKTNSAINFKADKSYRPRKGSTELHHLAESILSVMESKIRAVKKYIE